MRRRSGRPPLLHPAFLSCSPPTATRGRGGESDVQRRVDAAGRPARRVEHSIELAIAIRNSGRKPVSVRSIPAHGVKEKKKQGFASGEKHWVMGRGPAGRGRSGGAGRARERGGRRPVHGRHAGLPSRWARHGSSDGIRKRIRRRAR
ncbi:hypothetical protein GQ55_5G091800 [Panicum hallii var. hallii]|uniref:Uncharacterized protein n=1 Tax=Panicum hallii var. hallii TaxID=1504633 RepID=A0A2T7DEC5_9POAL|nr:hypothetical protein GQ55_5G091800 [Panicum hallii var. hallii]